MNHDEDSSITNTFNVGDILEGVPHGIALLDCGLRIVAMNRFLEGLTGFSSSDARGIYGGSIFRSNLGDRGQVFLKVLDTGEAVSIEGDIINRDRRKVAIQFTISPLRNQVEQIVGLIVVLEDISAFNSVMNTSLFHEHSTTGILGHSLKMQEVFELMPLMARTDASILITGETGTGKDLIAEAIHKASKRGRHPFIKINCGALPETLLESELFGHVRGSFTGAIKDKPGMFKLAQDGTIFLTEIGDMPLPLQVKLLSFLDDREFYPIGGDKKIQVDVRIIAATHRSLRDQVEQGNFREDLFYRLNVLHMHLPPLRERDGDIRFLLDHFLRELSARLNKKISGFTIRSLEQLTAYSYPGNIRELRNIVEYCANICQDDRIRSEHLPKYLLSTPLPPAKEGQDEQAAKTERSVINGSDPSRIGKDWMSFEKEMVINALIKTHGNRSKAAKELGWGRTTLWRKLNIHGLV
ncbi:MAG: sigma 54-interacting transcriptional regulator [Desulfocapsaceae bacterium]|nr:sigma 54-interacting transcriptional regulator [Desulfocapsaceae bacterium]